MKKQFYEGKKQYLSKINEHKRQRQLHESDDHNSDDNIFVQKGPGDMQFTERSLVMQELFLIFRLKDEDERENEASHNDDDHDHDHDRRRLEFNV